jgi:hypothetical protein
MWKKGTSKEQVQLYFERKVYEDDLLVRGEKWD